MVSLASLDWIQWIHPIIVFQPPLSKFQKENLPFTFLTSTLICIQEKQTQTKLHTSSFFTILDNNFMDITSKFKEFFFVHQFSSIRHGS